MLFKFNGVALKKVRKQKFPNLELFLRELYRQTGISVSRPTIHRWERGASEPNLSLAMELSRFLGVSVDIFLTKNRVKVTTK